MNITAELQAVSLLHPEMVDVKQQRCKFWNVARSGHCVIVPQSVMSVSNLGNLLSQ